METRFFTLNEVAERFNVSYFTIRRMVLDGELGYITLRGIKRIPASEVESWYQKHFVEPGGSRRQTGEVRQDA